MELSFVTVIANVLKNAVETNLQVIPVFPGVPVLPY